MVLCSGFRSSPVGTCTSLYSRYIPTVIFNHDLPRYVDYLDYGIPARCGIECNALVIDYVEGYPVCMTIVNATSTYINITDQKKSQSGVTVKMMDDGGKSTCSLSVYVICDLSRVQGPNSLEKSRTCDCYIVEASY
ncbi:uncharacterized protein J3R85_017191 [Psidium guajava]|nr:uncharacterized protein J3R85_017191 [Psidium guajava]